MLSKGVRLEGFKKKISSKFNDTLNILSALQKKFNVFLISRKSHVTENFILEKKKLNTIY